MKYNDLYREFKKEIPEGIKFYENNEEENFIDETDGIHIIFGTIIVPYILYSIRNNDIVVIKKVFSFLENMTMCKDVKVNEVLDFTILEQLADQGHDTLNKCKQYMGVNTMRHCDEVEKYFF